MSCGGAMDRGSMIGFQTAKHWYFFIYTIVANEIFWMTIERNPEVCDATGVK
jgi:hypothetical protein